MTMPPTITPRKTMSSSRCPGNKCHRRGYIMVIVILLGVNAASVSMEINKVISQWEVIAGQRFDPELRKQTLALARLPYAVCRSDEDFADLFIETKAGTR